MSPSPSDQDDRPDEVGRTGNASGLRARRGAVQTLTRKPSRPYYFVAEKSDPANENSTKRISLPFLSLPSKRMAVAISRRVMPQDCQGTRQNRRIVVSSLGQHGAIGMLVQNRPNTQKVSRSARNMRLSRIRRPRPCAVATEIRCLWPPQLAASFISNQARNKSYSPSATRRLRMAERRFGRKAEMALSSLPCAASRRLGRSRSTMLPASSSRDNNGQALGYF